MNGMKLIVKTVARMITGVIFLFGSYLALVGHLTLGGGITGGVVLALASVLEVLAFGNSAEEIKRKMKVATNLMSMGILLWLAIAVAGWLLPVRGGKIFLSNFLPKGETGAIISAGVIPLYNFILMLILGNALFAAFLTLIRFRIKMTEERQA